MYGKAHGLIKLYALHSTHAHSGAKHTWMLPMTPVDSILLATLTVLPQMS